MGNRAVITTKENKIGVYLHYHGGRDIVEAFLTYCQMRGYRAPEIDCYGWVRLAQVIGNFLGDGLGVGVDIVECLDCDNGDNGTYIVEGWKIVKREHYNRKEQQEYKLAEMLVAIDEAQPLGHQLGKTKILQLLKTK